MREKLVRVYEGLTFTDAQELADRLDNAGIEAFTGVTDSPVAGLVAGRQSKIVYVRYTEAEQARQIVRTFESEGPVGARPEDDAIESEAEAMELPTEQRPSTDSPSQDIEGGGNERLDADNVRLEAAEVDGLRLEEPGVANRDRDATGQRIRGFGADRDVAATPDAETDEVEDQPIDKLDATRQTRDEETATPAANLRPNAKGGEKRTQGRAKGPRVAREGGAGGVQGPATSKRPSGGGGKNKRKK